MPNYSIGELATKTGLAASAIRYYESLGLIPKPKRQGGRRVYAEADLKSLGIVLVAREAGFTMSEIKLIVQPINREKLPASKRWQSAARNKIEELDLQAKKIQQMKQLLNKILSCDCQTLKECVDYGVKNLFNNK